MPHGGSGGGAAFIVVVFFLALTVTCHNETWMLPGSGSGDARRGLALSLPN